MANALLTKGLAQGDRVILYVSNSLELVVAVAALSFGKWRFGVAGDLLWAWRLGALEMTVISKAEGDWRWPEQDRSASMERPHCLQLRCMR